MQVLRWPLDYLLANRREWHRFSAVTLWIECGEHVIERGRFLNCFDNDSSLLSSNPNRGSFHHASSFCDKFVDSNGESITPLVYRGLDCMLSFHDLLH